MQCMKPTHSTIIYNCNLYLSRLDNLKGIYEGSNCEFIYGSVKLWDIFEYLICEI